MKKKRAQQEKQHRRRQKLLVGLGVMIAVIVLVVVMVSRDRAPLVPEALKIRDWHDLRAVVNNLSAYYTLMNDLDSSTAGYEEVASPTANEGQGWQPIGTSDAPFTGHFDGRGYRIVDLFIERPGQSDVGLFGGLGPGGVIENVSLEGVMVTGAERVGALVGHIDMGVVRNCRSSGTIIGQRDVAGLVGYNLLGAVDNSFAAGSVAGEENVGGVVAVNDRGAVSNCYSTSSVAGGRGPAGLVAVNAGGTVDNSYYSYPDVLINGENVITIGALTSQDFEEWLANGKFMDIKDRLVVEGDYHLISTVSDFKLLLAFGQNASLKFRLTQDLDLSGEPGFYVPYLAGEFDGNGHKIANLSFNATTVGQVGLFGFLASSAKVTALGVEGVSIAGARYLGGLAGVNWEGVVDKSYSMGVISGEWHVGGLVGYNRGTISGSYSRSQVSGEGSVGGLVGTSAGTVSRSYSAGIVSAELAVAGGLVGQNEEATVTDCYSTASVACDRLVGGLVGANFAGTVSKCYSAGRVTGLYLVGGLVGDGFSQAVSYSFWDKETSGTESGEVGVGMPTAMMRQLSTFVAGYWSIAAVARGQTDPDYVWNIVDGEGYPFLSWQSVT